MKICTCVCQFGSAKVVIIIGKIKKKIEYYDRISNLGKIQNINCAFTVLDPHITFLTFKINPNILLRLNEIIFPSNLNLKLNEIKYYNELNKKQIVAIYKSYESDSIKKLTLYLQNQIVQYLQTIYKNGLMEVIWVITKDKEGISTVEYKTNTRQEFRNFIIKPSLGRISRNVKEIISYYKLKQYDTVEEIIRFYSYFDDTDTEELHVSLTYPLSRQQNMDIMKQYESKFDIEKFNTNLTILKKIYDSIFVEYTTAFDNYNKMSTTQDAEYFYKNKLTDAQGELNKVVPLSISLDRSSILIFS